MCIYDWYAVSYSNLKRKGIRMHTVRLQIFTIGVRTKDRIHIQGTVHMNSGIFLDVAVMLYVVGATIMYHVRFQISNNKYPR